MNFWSKFLSSTKPRNAKHWPGLIHTYRDLLDIDNKTKVLTLCEGNTPLIPAPAIADTCGVIGLSVYLKFEGANPSGSFKDRGMTMAVTKAVANGLKTMVCASTGNTSASAAAYSACARSNGYSDVQCVVLVPDGFIALGKLAQAIIYGAKVVQIAGNFDQALNIVKELSQRESIALVNSVNPDRIEGQKTAAFEICDQLGGRAPDILATPVGNAGNISAYWAGFKQYNALGLIKNKPKMYGFQAAGSAPIVLNEPVENPETIATAIRIGNPASWKTAKEAVNESFGLIDSVTDEEIVEAYKLIHSSQGVCCEPASAASVAGLIKASKQGKVERESTIVCVLTGNGLKDPQTAIDVSGFAPIKSAATMDAVASAIGL
ncbi:MAG: threonine synthase [Candidatus Caenarcaniphilales bacterium]|nr:threonine synthase [Candidatus Caenarcaniphilales bacterium]